MPFTNEHASRLIDPKTLEARAGWLGTTGGVKRTHGSGNGKVQGVGVPATIDVIWYIYKDKSVIAQTLRFPIKEWTSEQALKWLKDNNIKYLSFEKATNGKNLQELLYKNFTFQHEIKDIDTVQGVIRLYANAYGNKDSDGDISEQGSFTKTCRERLKQIKHLKDHDRKQLLGFPIEFDTSDSYGLLVTSKINMEKQICKDVFSDYKFFAENKRPIEHSIGYGIVKFTIENAEDYAKRIRRIQEYKLYEYSTLSFLGANDRSIAVDAKGQNIYTLKEDMILLNEMFEKGNYSDEHFKEIEQKLSDIKDRINEMKTLNIEEPQESTPIIEPNSLFEKSDNKINYINIINKIKLN
jgi:HK97 family phage prohead protease